MAAMASGNATPTAVGPAVGDFVLVRIAQDVLPACVVQCNGSAFTVRPLQSYYSRNMRRTVNWRKNPAGAKANRLVTLGDFVSGSFQLIDGTLPAVIDHAVTTKHGASDSESLKRMPAAPLVPPIPFGRMPAISEAEPRASQGEFHFRNEVKQLRALGFSQEGQLQDVLLKTHGSVEQSVQHLNARRRFKHPTAFSEIKQMGFSNDEVIKALLMKHHGNKESVVLELLG